MRRLSNNAIAVLMILFIVIVSANFIYLNLTARQVITARGAAIGQASICINEPPVLYEDCPRNVSVYSLYRCDVNATDGDADTLTFLDYADFFEIGNVSGDIIFVPNNTVVGNNSVTISVNDNIGCSNSQVNASFWLYVYSVCGDGLCTTNESYSTCPDDCIRPYEAPAPSSGSSSSVGTRAPKGGFSLIAEPSFVMLPNILIQSLAPGSRSEDTFIISNNGTRKVAVIFSVEGVSKFVTLSEPGVTLNKKEAKDVKVSFKVPVDQKLGTYTGRIVGKAEDLEKSIAVILEVESRLKRFDLSLFIPKEYLSVDAGSELISQITIFDTSRVAPADIRVRYMIKDLQNNLILDERDSVRVDNQVSFQKSFVIPEDVPSGTYVLSVELSHRNQLSIATHEFKIVGEERAAAFRLPVKAVKENKIGLAGILAALALGSMAVYWLWRRGVI